MGGRRIGIFGGTFDPPHVAHLAVAEAAREQAELDSVVWIPAAASPFKPDQPGPSPEHRLTMTRLATEDNPAFGVSDVEIVRGGVSYTVDTVEELGQRLPGAEWMLLLGGDSLRSFADWRDPHRIVEKARLLVYRRPADRIDPGEIDDWLRRRVDFVDAPPIDLSSTDIRRALAEGRSVRYLVPDSVRAYLTENRLYPPRSA